MVSRILIVFILLISINQLQAQLAPLTVEKIMRDPKWIGTSPSNPSWSADGNTLYFSWNPDKNPADSLYSINRLNKLPAKVNIDQRRTRLLADDLVYNLLRTRYTYEKEGDIFLVDVKTNQTKRIIQSPDNESNPQFSFSDSKIVYRLDGNLYGWDIASGETMQLTNFTASLDKKPGDTAIQERWLKNDQLQLFEVLKERNEKKQKREEDDKAMKPARPLRSIPLDGKELNGLSISPDGRFISYQLISTETKAKSTIVPSYVTESGFVTDIPGRTKVGASQNAATFYVYDRLRDSIHTIHTDSIPGIRDLPEYLKDYPAALEKAKANPVNRPVDYQGLSWSPNGKQAELEIIAQDNKDRWLLLFDTATGKLKLLDRQHDEAWIGGPGTGGFISGVNEGWLDEDRFWYQSESTGFSHLYTVNVVNGQKKALTSGNYEVQQASLSVDKKTFYLITNEVHPGEQQFYRLPANGGKAERISTMTGANTITLSPDEKYIAILYSYSNRPWELFLQENKPGGKLEQITNKAMSSEFQSYAWRDPELIKIPARDQVMVPARLYRPKQADPLHPAVIFVHGAGYLQNAHKWWSYYYREMMFNNLLADQGYYVLDVDYRGSAGYGRDWRTAIYRHMGGKDLDDQVDAAAYLVKNFGVDPKRIGVYGGSYGGFITLMGLFTQPDVFAAGAALRPVTDWANYNHGYTACILNEPFTDSLAYRLSSPIYYAAGLKNHLLICHGMIDVNVHFQDAVKLQQRLIELGKNDWELAAFPLEDHGFVEPSSWTDEYKRIYKLFESVLRK